MSPYFQTSVGAISYTNSLYLRNEAITPTDTGYVYRYLLTQLAHCAADCATASPVYSDAVIAILPELDPFGEGIDTFIYAIRDVVNAAVADAAATTGVPSFAVDAYLYSTTADLVDTASVVVDTTPRVLAIIAATIFAMMVVSYRSLIIPVRMIATVAFTLCCTFGATTIDFGFLPFVDAAAEGEGTFNPLFFCLPVLCLAVSVGISSDFDAFLSLRVYDHFINLTGPFRCEPPTRAEKHRERILVKAIARAANRKAVIDAVADSGTILNAAGIIMFIAFAALGFCSSIPMLRQFSFCLSLGVLIDTFFTRTILGPALSFILGPLAWEPNFGRKPIRVPKDMCEA
eukprot:gnl/Ergobibamus_cyprinoides/540.p1 GENE.gnl/Ergobibamus_cyprinoides/540~~gnl/Ergobibamus_cyprinoides/540.p1  ORF type:complete len:345 (+),score=125.05 gnl/Ergobibamus_cyprinoides/540:582-1616(+)